MAYYQWKNNKIIKFWWQKFYKSLIVKYKNFIGPSAVAGRVLNLTIGSGHLSILLPVLPSSVSLCLSMCFLRIVSLVLSKFWHGPRNPYEVVRGGGFSGKKFFAQKLGNGPKMGQKQVFFNLFKN